MHHLLVQLVWGNGFINLNPRWSWGACFPSTRRQLLLILSRSIWLCVHALLVLKSTHPILSGSACMPLFVLKSTPHPSLSTYGSQAVRSSLSSRLHSLLTTSLSQIVNKPLPSPWNPLLTHLPQFRITESTCSLRLQIHCSPQFRHTAGTALPHPEPLNSFPIPSHSLCVYTFHFLKFIVHTILAILSGRQCVLPFTPTRMHFSQWLPTHRTCVNIYPCIEMLIP